jgi:hypothetical protein
VHAPAAEVLLGLGEEGPVEAPPPQLPDQAGRAHQQRVVAAPGLEQEDADGRVLGQSIGQHAAGRACPDDDVVVHAGDILDPRRRAISGFRAGEQPSLDELAAAEQQLRATLVVRRTARR